MISVFHVRRMAVAVGYDHNTDERYNNEIDTTTVG